MTMGGRVGRTLRRHPLVRSVRLVGSRARGTATEHSDWDLLVDAADFPALAADLPDLVRPLDPLAQLWDPLSRHHVYALVLPGPVKVDLLFAVPHEPAPPWRPGPDTLPAIDAHFWDWLLWLTGKRHRGDEPLVRSELAKMHRHLLGPLSVQAVPATLEEAAAAYLAAADRAEQTFGVRVPRRLRQQVGRHLLQLGGSRLEQAIERCDPQRLAGHVELLEQARRQQRPVE